MIRCPRGGRHIHWRSMRCLRLIAIFSRHVDSIDSGIPWSVFNIYSQVAIAQRLSAPFVGGVSSTLLSVLEQVVRSYIHLDLHSFYPQLLCGMAVNVTFDLEVPEKCRSDYAVCRKNRNMFTSLYCEVLGCLPVTGSKDVVNAIKGSLKLTTFDEPLTR